MLFWLGRGIDRVVPFNANIGFIGKLPHSIVGFLLEANCVGAAGDLAGSSLTFWDRGFLRGYGVRLSGNNFALDLSFMKPIIQDVEDPFIIGYPWISAT
jgi:hypothetical protein